LNKNIRKIQEFLGNFFTRLQQITVDILDTLIYFFAFSIRQRETKQGNIIEEEEERASIRGGKNMTHIKT